MIREMRQSLHHVVAFIHPTTVGIELGVGAINERFNQNLPATCQRPNLWLVEVHTASCCAAYVKVIVLVEGFDDTTCFFNCLQILVNEHFCLLVLEDVVDTFQILPWPFSVRPHVDVPKGTTFQIPDGWKRGGTTSHPTAVIGLKDFSEPFLELCLVPGDFALHLPQFFFHFLGSDVRLVTTVTTVGRTLQGKGIIKRMRVTSCDKQKEVLSLQKSLATSNVEQQVSEISATPVGLSTYPRCFQEKKQRNFGMACLR